MGLSRALPCSQALASDLWGGWRLWRRHDGGTQAHGGSPGDPHPPCQTVATDALCFFRLIWAGFLIPSAIFPSAAPLQQVIPHVGLCSPKNLINLDLFEASAV